MVLPAKLLFTGCTKLLPGGSGPKLFLPWEGREGQAERERWGKETRRNVWVGTRRAWESTEGYCSLFGCDSCDKVISQKRSEVLTKKLERWSGNEREREIVQHSKQRRWSQERESERGNRQWQRERERERERGLPHQFCQYTLAVSNPQTQIDLDWSHFCLQCQCFMCFFISSFSVPFNVNILIQHIHWSLLTPLLGWIFNF